MKGVNIKVTCLSDARISKTQVRRRGGGGFGGFERTPFEDQ